MRPRGFWLVSLALAVLWMWAPAFAQEPADQAALGVWIDTGPSGLDKSEIRRAIERELGTRVELADTAETQLRVIVEDRSRVRVGFTTSSGEELSRTVDLPASRERSVEVIALLVGNLTRNEAADLLAALGAERESADEEPAPEAPAPATEATTAPAPPRVAETSDGLIRAQPALNLSLFHPLSLYRDSDRRVLNFELGLAYGRVGAVEGVAIEIGLLRVEQHVQGLALGAFSIVGGPVKGANIGYLYAEGHGPLQGLDAGVLVVWRDGITQGVAAGGLVQIGEAVEGLAAAGVASVTGRVQGVAVAGITTVGKDLSGVQVSGVTNVSNDVQGVEVSSLANVTRNVRGLTVGLVNVGRNVDGAQIGLVNVASEVHGGQIGLVNIADNGRIHAVAFGTNHVALNLGVKFVTGLTYSEIAFGYDPANGKSVPSAGLGVHFEIGGLTLEPGFHVSVTGDARGNDDVPERVDLHYRAVAGYRVLPFLEPFAGGGVRHGTYEATEDEIDPEFIAGLVLF